jgi:hypothetical protein
VNAYLLLIPATGIGRDSGAEPQSLVSVQNIPGLYPESLCSAHEVKAYVWGRKVSGPLGLCSFLERVD